MLSILNSAFLFRIYLDGQDIDWIEPKRWPRTRSWSIGTSCQDWWEAWVHSSTAAAAQKYHMELKKKHACSSHSFDAIVKSRKLCSNSSKSRFWIFSWFSNIRKAVNKLQLLQVSVSALRHVHFDEGPDYPSPIGGGALPLRLCGSFIVRCTGCRCFSSIGVYVYTFRGLQSDMIVDDTAVSDLARSHWYASNRDQCRQSIHSCHWLPHPIIISSSWPTYLISLWRVSNNRGTWRPWSRSPRSDSRMDKRLSRKGWRKGKGKAKATAPIIPWHPVQISTIHHPPSTIHD